MCLKVAVAIGDKLFSDIDAANLYLEVGGITGIKGTRETRLVMVPRNTPTIDTATIQAEIDNAFAECDAILNS